MLALQSSLSKMEASSDFTNTRLEAATTELDAVKVELSETKKIMSTLESDHRVALNSAESASSQLELERELRSRAEHRESSERQERIAASAQLLATQSDCNARIQELERKMRADVEKVKSLLDSSQADLEKKALARVTELEEELRLAEVTRRKLHNTIQELRGNVRVFARVRPFLPSDAAQGSVGASESSIEHRAEDHAFTFDRVFGPSSSQECVFKEVSEFVQSALDGYNVCLFSYGQTGSGKTHTMQGSGSGVQRGIIARAMEQYHMEVSFIEIYNETIRDLLRTNPTDDIRHDIKRDSTGHTMTAARHRSVGQTAMNERSSRSHSVFCLHLRASNE
eukprot:GSChrysophyteH1.ASY1.ANO1.1752.1 assembled CDS